MKFVKDFINNYTLNCSKQVRKEKNVINALDLAISRTFQYTVCMHKNQ